jgi:hypothetical protein
VIDGTDQLVAVVVSACVSATWHVKGSASGTVVAAVAGTEIGKGSVMVDPVAGYRVLRRYPHHPGCRRHRPAVTGRHHPGGTAPAAPCVVVVVAVGGLPRRPRAAGPTCARPPGVGRVPPLEGQVVHHPDAACRPHRAADPAHLLVGAALPG